MYLTSMDRTEPYSREEAERRIKAIKEPYKLEILQSIKVGEGGVERTNRQAAGTERTVSCFVCVACKQTEPITIYHIGEEWWDLCAGPHVESTGDLPSSAIKLTSLVRRTGRTGFGPHARARPGRAYPPGYDAGWAGGSLLAWRREEGHADEDLRHSLGEQGAAQGR